MPERSCPACNRNMKAARLGRIPLDLCLPCSAVWFDHGELTQLVQGGTEAIRKLGQRLYSARSEAPTLHPSKCPVCWIPMGDFEFPSMPGLRLDGCPLCSGFWVPLEKLGVILKKVEERTPRPAPATSTRDLPDPGPLYPAPPIIPREPTPVSPASPAVPTPVRAAAPSPPTGAPRAPKPGPALPKPSPAAARPPVGSKCAACGEVNSAGAAVCWACGGFLRPAGAGQCPGCAAPMSREVLDGIDFGFCEACGGVWLENKRLDALRAQPEVRTEKLVYELRDRTGTATPLPGVTPSCPRCRVSLMPEMLGMLSTDPIQTCSQCYGSFLERGRLSEFLIGRRL